MERSYALFQVDDVNEPFELNANTGEIRLKKKLDFEEFQSYQVDIEATDGGGLSGKCSVVIKNYLAIKYYNRNNSYHLLGNY